MNNQEIVSIIIPVFNESEGIDNLFKEINEYHLKRKFEFEIIFVNDGSIDNTAELISNHKSLPYNCRLINFSKNFGAHAAVRAGFLHAVGGFITSLPADLQISFDTIEKLHLNALSGYDIVFGVREENEIGLIENIFSRLYALMMQKYVNKNFPFKGLETLLFNRKVLNIFNENIESNSFGL